MSQEPKTMKDLAAVYGNRLVPVKDGDIIEVKILEIQKNKILADVAGYYTGIVPEREFSTDIGDLKVGDKTLAYILNLENQDGNCILSLRRADKEKVSKILEEKFTTGGVLAVKCYDANRGGLLCSFGEYEGFLPVSQLASSHYPKVSAGDKEEILTKLKQLVNQNFQVKVITFEPGGGKLIFSEKAAGDAVQQEKIKKYKIGDVLEGQITGIVDFGLFVNLGEVEGLVHISEISWEHVGNLRDLFKVGDKIKAQIISTENNRLSLSIKRLTEDPWLKLAKKYQIGDEVEAEVTRLTPFGAFVVFEKMDGLVHISELGEKVTNPAEVVEVGKKYHFRIVAIEPELHKLSLSLKKHTPKDDKKDAKKPSQSKTKKSAPKKKEKK